MPPIEFIILPKYILLLYLKQTSLYRLESTIVHPRTIMIIYYFIKRVHIYYYTITEPKGLEPSLPAVTGRCFNQLSYDSYKSQKSDSNR